MNIIEMRTGWGNKQVEVEWSIDDDDLNFKVWFDGSDVTGLLSQTQFEDIDYDLRDFIYNRSVK